MALPGRNTWSMGVCRRELGQRSYIVDVAGHTYRRNRRQLRSTNELVPIADDQTPVGAENAAGDTEARREARRASDTAQYADARRAQCNTHDTVQSC